MGLANYGIHTEQADYRLHVCVLAQRVYAFPRLAAVAAVNRRALDDQEGHKTVATQTIDGPVLTATGYAIPVEEIEPIYEIAIPRGWLHHDMRVAAHIHIHPEMDTTAKGQKAERIVRALWRLGYLNFLRPLSLQEMRDLGDQLNGIDLQLVAPNLQVKCDFAGGRGKGCTGNLFIQLSESNPFNRH